MRKALRLLLFVALAGIGLVLAGLVWAHIAIRREQAPLPSSEQIAAPGSGEHPVRLSYINTASQVMPRSDVLTSYLDPDPNGPYVMSHPSFVLEWADGSILLVDAGMTRAGAEAFGRPLELLGAAKPIQPLGSVAERLGEARRRVRGVIFTHLHIDHVGGLVDLCAGREEPVDIPMTQAQAQRPNYTTRPGLKLLRSSCARQQVLSGGPLLPLPGFPGVAVFAAGGHTPGSQIVVAHVQTADGLSTVLFVGDIVNQIEGITYDIPKPFLYRTFVVPEADERLSQLRRFLRAMRQDGEVTLLPAHDQLHLENSGVPPFPPDA
jgi:glyoxylase-like metal-dependent hydrolase (beta-lactamase superfamily II)